MNDPNDGTWTYEYDCGGNILNKKQYAYTTGTLGTVQQIVSYAYGDSDWKDKLTRFNGVDIAYDAIGNPIHDGVWAYTWENGRQLRRMACDATIAEFVYNADGLRVQKTVNGITTNYTLHGKNIVHMTKGNAELHFWYDAQNRPAIVEFNGAKYGYLYNLQGDVIGLIDGANNEVVKYTYDAWGKPLSVTGSPANTIGYYNPFRYRGYVYDVETGLYYLRSRYYNPRWGRFVNADKIIRKSLLGYNLYSYCRNDPENNHDSSGNAYDRIAAVKYALEYCYKCNQQYYNYVTNGDCTNFTSQCLYGGGIQMDDKWYSRRGKKRIYAFLIPDSQYKHRYGWDVSPAWSIASHQFEYFRESEYVNACQEIDGSSTIEEILSSGIQVGDIIYFDWESDGVLDHSVIVTEISDDEVYLTYHSTDRERQALSVLLDPKMEGYLLLFKD